MSAKTARILFLGIVGVVFGLLAWPRNIMIDQTIEATEYSLTDTNYAVPHTVTIKGTCRGSQMRDGSYEGTFSISGIPSTQNAIARMDKITPHGINRVYYFLNDTEYIWPGEVCDFCCNKGFSSGALTLLDIKYHSDSISGTWPGEKGRILVWPADSRSEAIAVFNSMYQIDDR